MLPPTHPYHCMLQSSPASLRSLARYGKETIPSSHLIVAAPKDYVVLMDLELRPFAGGCQAARLRVTRRIARRSLLVGTKSIIRRMLNLSPFRVSMSKAQFSTICPFTEEISDGSSVLITPNFTRATTIMSQSSWHDTSAATDGTSSGHPGHGSNTCEGSRNHAQVSALNHGNGSDFCCN